MRLHVMIMECHPGAVWPLDLFGHGSYGLWVLLSHLGSPCSTPEDPVRYFSSVALDLI